MSAIGKSARVPEKETPSRKKSSSLGYLRNSIGVAVLRLLQISKQKELNYLTYSILNVAGIVVYPYSFSTSKISVWIIWPAKALRKSLSSW